MSIVSLTLVLSRLLRTKSMEGRNCEAEEGGSRQPDNVKWKSNTIRKYDVFRANHFAYNTLIIFSCTLRPAIISDPLVNLIFSPIARNSFKSSHYAFITCVLLIREVFIHNN